MLLTLILIPLIGIFILSATISYDPAAGNVKLLKSTALAITILDLIVSLIIFILFDCSSKQFQFVQEHYEISYFDFYLGIDGLSMYFVLLTTIIMPIALISNWKSIKQNTVIFLIIILLLETLLLLVFLILDILLFYIFFESILAPLFILIGLFGSNEKVRASFYLFLYTLLGSLFMLLSIITMLSLIGTTDFDVLSKTNFDYITQLFLFYGIFIAFAIKTPVIYLNNWLLKAHVESPLSGSIILAAIVLKLSLYGIVRLILPLLPKAFIYNTYIIFLIGVLTIIYASLSTLRTIDVKELIAYSSVSHAAVYLLGMFSNVIQGIEGAIALGIAHGFVSSGLFICAGGILYDRSSTRLITYYRGIAQIMPIFSIMFFILSLGNAGTPLTLNFIGEFMSLYGIFERLPLAGALASSSIVFSAAYTIFMFNRIAFAGPFFMHFWYRYIPDLNKREFSILLILILFIVIFGLYTAPLLDGLHYNVYNLIYNFNVASSESAHSIKTLNDTPVPLWDVEPEPSDKWGWGTLVGIGIMVGGILTVCSWLETVLNKKSDPVLEARFEKSKREIKENRVELKIAKRSIPGKSRSTLLYEVANNLSPHITIFAGSMTVHDYFGNPGAQRRGYRVDTNLGNGNFLEAPVVTWTTSSGIVRGVECPPLRMHNVVFVDSNNRPIKYNATGTKMLVPVHPSIK